MISRSFIILCFSAVLLHACVPTAIVTGTVLLGQSTHDERSLEEQARDTTIESKIATDLITSKDVHSRRLTVQVIHGNVYLIGYLPNQKEIETSVGIAKRVEHVRRVKTYIRIGTATAQELTEDSWITSKVKSALFNDDIVSGYSVHVKTVAGEVYLMGLMKKKEHRYRAAKISSRIKGVKKVHNLLIGGKYAPS